MLVRLVDWTWQAAATFDEYVRGERDGGGGGGGVVGKYGVWEWKLIEGKEEEITLGNMSAWHWSGSNLAGYGGCLSVSFVFKKEVRWE